MTPETRILVITGSVREQRIGSTVTDWFLRTVRALPGLDAVWEHIDLAHLRAVEHLRAVVSESTVRMSGVSS